MRASKKFVSSFLGSIPAYSDIAWVRSRHPPTQCHLRAADEAVLKKYLKTQQNPAFKVFYRSTAVFDWELLVAYMIPIADFRKPFQL
jgi:hypothetical protein